MINRIYRGVTRRMESSKNHFRRKVSGYLKRRRIKNTDFTIIASNCIGARIYQELSIEYNTPFVGLFILAPCYIKLLGKLEFYLHSHLSFTDTSRYSSVNTKRESRDWYPIGLLHNDIELHFIHYKDEYEARSKWNRRLQRMNMNRLFILFTDRDMCKEDHLMQFDQLPFKNKICFTANPMPYVKSSFAITEYNGRPYIDDLYSNFHILERHFDYIDWLNGGTGKMP